MHTDITNVHGSKNRQTTKNYNTNILILGKTGVGKSSLVNYLYGQNIAIAKSGKPVTERGFHRHAPFMYRSLTVTVYDSWGLESDKVNEWRRDLTAELERTDTDNIADWFHTVIYCYDAKRSRLDDYEKTHILDELVNNGVKIIFAMTKWGLCSEREKSAARETLNKFYPGFSLIPIESVSQKLRNQTTTVQQGREELFNEICINLRDNLIARLISRTREQNLNTLKKSKEEVLEYYDSKSGFFTIYGENFKNAIIKHTSEVYRANLKRDYNDFSAFYDQINDMSRQVVRAYTGLNIDTHGKIIDDIVSRYANIVTGWENSFREYLSSILIFLSGLPGLIIRRLWITRSYRKKIENKLDELNRKVSDDITVFLNSVQNTENHIKEKFLNTMRARMNSGKH